MRFYAGVGSRRTPSEVLDLMQLIARSMAHAGWCLYSGGAAGADTAFEQGAASVDGPRTIFIPWDGFSGRFRRNDPNLSLGGAPAQAMELAAQTHPAWAKCRSGARKLHARNSYQVLGPTLTTPVELVICWTPGGLGTGGTGQAIRIARAHGIKVHDLAIPRIRAAYERRLA